MVLLFSFLFVVVVVDSVGWGDLFVEEFRSVCSFRSS